eukprot:2574043-Rhodomonas_salina.1
MVLRTAPRNEGLHPTRRRLIAPGGLLRPLGWTAGERVLRCLVRIIRVLRARIGLLPRGVSVVFRVALVGSLIVMHVSPGLELRDLALGFLQLRGQRGVLFRQALDDGSRPF